MFYDDYVMKGAKTAPAAGLSRPGAHGQIGPVPTHGSEFVPRRIYIKPGDLEMRGYTDGCRGCAWLVNKLGPRVNHNDGCRMRMEKIIGDDENDERTKKVKERFDHYLAQQVDEGDVNKKSANDPRHDMPDEAKTEIPRVDDEEHRE